MIQPNCSEIVVRIFNPDSVPDMKVAIRSDFPVLCVHEINVDGYEIQLIDERAYFSDTPMTFPKIYALEKYLRESGIEYQVYPEGGNIDDYEQWCQPNCSTLVIRVPRNVHDLDSIFKKIKQTMNYEFQIEYYLDGAWLMMESEGETVVRVRDDEENYHVIVSSMLDLGGIIDEEESDVRY